MTNEVIDAYKYSTDIPHKSIKKGYDVFTGSGFTNIINPGSWVGGYNGWPICDHPRNPLNKILTVDNETKKGLHRDLWCRKYGIFGRDCGDCDFGGQGSSDARKDWIIRGLKVPIGVDVSITEGNAGTNSKTETTRCNHFSGTSNSDVIGYGIGDFEKITTQRLPDDVATGCSSGTNKKPNEFVKTYNNYKIQNNWRDPNSKSDECWVGVDQTKTWPNSVCVTGKLHLGSYCQLGDNIINDIRCKNVCKGCLSGRCSKNLGKGDGKGCEYAFERLCKKKKGYPLKRDPITEQIIYSNEDYIRSPECMEFCGSANDPKCRNVKNELCSDTSEWMSVSWLPEYCKSWWSENKDIQVMNDICGDKLIDRNSEQNVFSREGCGKLCLGDGLDVDKNWCREKKLQYCTKDDENMLSKECWKFCSEPENAGLCDGYLDGNKGGFCGRLGVKTQDDLKKKIPGTDRQISDWCGCMMPTKFYQDIGEKKLRDFKAYGYAVNGSVDFSPECSFPLCKIGSVKTNAQQERLKNGECTDCVQIMLNKMTGNNILNSDFVKNQDMNCERIQNINTEETEPLPSGIYDLEGKKIKVYSDNSYCEYKNEEEFIKDNPEFSEDYELNENQELPEIIRITEIPSSNNLRQTQGCLINDTSEQQGNNEGILGKFSEEKEVPIIAAIIIGLIVLCLISFGIYKIATKNKT